MFVRKPASLGTESHMKASNNGDSQVPEVSKTGAVFTELWLVASRIPLTILFGLVNSLSSLLCVVTVWAIWFKKVFYGILFSTCGAFSLYWSAICHFNTNEIIIHVLGAKLLSTTVAKGFEGFCHQISAQFWTNKDMATSILSFLNILCIQ